MHVDLITTTKGNPKVIHGTDNGKKTACGINLTKPENIGMYTNTGEMTDVIQMTCDKCKTVIAKRLIKESNREMAAQLKEEQKMLKRERAASKHQHEGEVSVPAPSSSGSSSSSSSGGYIPPSMRKAKQEQEKQGPIEAPTPAPPPPVSMPAPTPAAPAPANDVLSQFAIPTVPGSVPNTPPVPPVPSAPTPAAPKADDVLSQFSIPTVPTSVPGMPQPAPQNDVLSQFAIPSVPSAVPGSVPPPAPVPQNDVLAQFAIPSVPSARPEAVQIPAPQPTPGSDVLGQFAIPTVPTSLPNTAPKAAPAAAADDLLAQFSIPNPTVSRPQSAPEIDVPTAPPIGGRGAVQQDDILAQFSINPNGNAFANVPTVNAEIDEQLSAAAPKYSATDEVVEVTPVPAPNDYDPFAKQPSTEKSPEQLLNDLMMMSNGNAPAAPKQADPLPDIATVPTSLPNVPTTPTLNIPPIPPVAPVSPIPPVTQAPIPPLSQMPTSGIPDSFTVPTAPPTNPMYQQAPVLPTQQIPTPQPVTSYPAQPNLFTAPSSSKQKEPDAPTPLFVGYSADGRQLFQTYDALGNPIPINEPVYSAPPEQPKNTPLMAAGAAAAMMPGSGAPVMDMDELMAKMGIEDPKKKKVDEGKAINYTEYKIPPKKKKTNSPKKPKQQQQDNGPVSAAEAKRRKKVDKINKEFEKQLIARGIDPKTGGIMMDKK